MGSGEKCDPLPKEEAQPKKNTTPVKRHGTWRGTGGAECG